MNLLSMIHEDMLKHIIQKYIEIQTMKLRDWIDESKLDWYHLSKNPNALELLRQHPEKIHSDDLSQTSNAIHVLADNMDKTKWNWLSENPNAIHMLERNKEKINWRMFSRNPSIFTPDPNYYLSLL